MEMHQVRYFLALCEERHFARAAKRRSVAQPSLTRAIKQLEKELGGSLFIRDRVNTRLTSLGILVRSELAQIDRSATEAKRKAAKFPAARSVKSSQSRAIEALKRVFICAAFGVLATGGSVNAQQPPAAALSITQESQQKAENFENSFQIMKRSAEIGDARAQLKLGMMYADGKGIPRNSAGAIIWLRRAAEQGRPEAAYQLGIQYEDGIGVAQDVWLAMHWFRRSAQSAYPDAQNAIGELYLGYKGIPTDYTEAISMFHLAADSYNAQAMYNLGMRFALGQGVRHNLVKAFKWFEQSVRYAEPGDEREKATRAREVIRKEMAPLQLYTALRIIYAPKTQRFFDQYSRAFYK